jgi:hypothetical protein
MADETALTPKRVRNDRDNDSDSLANTGKRLSNSFPTNRRSTTGVSLRAYDHPRPCRHARICAEALAT